MGTWVMKVISILLLLVIAGIIISTCDDNSPTKSKSDIIDLSVTPMENEEAELAAMWLSGELVAPVDLYERIIDELQVIRGMWDDSVPEVLIEYKPFLEPSKLVLFFQQAAFDSVLSEEYHQWEELNSYYRLNNMRTNSSRNLIILEFEGRLNPVVLSEQYSILTGVDSIMHYPHRFPGPFGEQMTTIFIYNAEGNLKYFFHKDGEIQGGIRSTIDYFDFENGSAIYRGRSNLWFEPKWGDTLLMAIENFIYPDTLPFEY